MTKAEIKKEIKGIKLSDYNHYILILDRHIEYTNFVDTPYHLLFHTKTMKNKVDKDMNDYYGINLIDAVKYYIKIKDDKDHDKIFEFENKYKINILIMDDTSIIEDIKYEEYPHLIWVHDISWKKDIETIDFWKIGGFYDTIGTILRHCKGFYDDFLNKENCEENEEFHFDIAHDLVDYVEDTEQQHMYYKFYKNKNLTDMLNTIDVEIWLLQNCI